MCNYDDPYEGPAVAIAGIVTCRVRRLPWVIRAGRIYSARVTGYDIGNQIVGQTTLLRYLGTWTDGDTRSLAATAARRALARTWFADHLAASMLADIAAGRDPAGLYEAEARIREASEHYVRGEDAPDPLPLIAAEQLAIDPPSGLSLLARMAPDPLREQHDQVRDVFRILRRS